MRKRIMVVHKDRCNPIGCGGYLCMRVSPSNKMGKEAILKDNDGKVRVNEEAISDADRIAANKCPFDALSMINLPEKLDDPIHRYGENGFVLFKLPIPIFGKVTGLVGKNGIGKTTALKILSGELFPNLGKKESTKEEIIKYFAGSEGQNYFEKLYDNKIKVSFKPQQVELIPRNFKGSVKELLLKVNEKNQLEEISEKLELKKILDHDISKISGGELQRVAIAATVLKKANVYFFDEPTSYLDIKQRLKISRFIRSLADENTAVLIIEHDLIILDYLTDLIHVVYGKEAEYGIVSGIKSSKAGINSYISGYLKEENVQFRDKSLQFHNLVDFGKKQQFPLLEWNKSTEKFGDFKLNLNNGKINTNEICGIIGENGIGKTSFVNTISKNKNLKISFKKQYLEPTEELVQTFIGSAFSNTLIMKMLQLEHLLNKQVNKLSGGEMQRVFIAKTLGEEHDLVLMDEPSAYLDVEQRLQVSKLVEEFCRVNEKSAIIVDHDLLFIDHVSDNLFVFEGTPALEGNVEGPFELHVGMNKFLKELNITFRRDEETNRPRANKPNSQMDRKQKDEGKLYA